MFRNSYALIRFMNKVRALGQSFGASIHWVFAALITLITPVFLDKDNGIFKDNPWPIFAFFAFYDGFTIGLGYNQNSGNKGVSLQNLEKKLVKQ